MDASESPTRPSFDSYGSSPSSSSSSSLASIPPSTLTSPTFVDFDAMMVDVQPVSPLTWPITPYMNFKDDAPVYFDRPPSFDSIKSDVKTPSKTFGLRSKVSAALLSGWAKSARRRTDSLTNASISSASTVSARTSDEYSQRQRCDSLDSSVESDDVDPTDCSPPARTTGVSYCADDTAATRHNDRRACELLTTLAQGSPSFFPYASKAVPRRVLDIACGDGTWMLMAAQRWTTTEFVGIDVRTSWPSLDEIRERLGSSASRVEFREANFLCDLSQFAPESFELVRMSYVGLALGKGFWKQVLADVKRILTIGGRVEFIDEAPIFPSDEPFEFGLADGGEDTSSVLEAQFRHMLVSRGFLQPNVNVREGFWGRPSHCLQHYIGNASPIAAFDISLPAQEKDGGEIGERTLRSKKSLSTIRVLDDLSLSTRQRKDTLQVPSTPPVGVASSSLEAKLLVQPMNSGTQITLRMSTVDAQLHASHNMQTLLSHTEALWSHMHTAHHGMITRAEFDDAIWEYECSQRLRLGLDIASDPINDWDDAFKPPQPTRTSDTLSGISRRVRVIQVWEARKTA